MKKSVSIPDELAYKVQDMVYAKRTKNPKESNSFSEIVVEALRDYFQPKNEGVNECKK